MNKIAGKKSKWKIVEKEFVQGKDVSQNDAWKLILLSDFFPKVSLCVYIADLIIKTKPQGTTTFADIVDDHSDSSSEDDDEDETDDDGGIEEVEEEGDAN